MFRWLVVSAAERAGLVVPAARVLMPATTKKQGGWSWEDDEPFDIVEPITSATFRPMVCSLCRVQFDDAEDFDDHTLFIHHKTPDHWEPKPKSRLELLAGGPYA
jgi:hypothetical protein